MKVVDVKTNGHIVIVDNDGAQKDIGGPRQIVKQATEYNERLSALELKAWQHIILYNDNMRMGSLDEVRTEFYIHMKQEKALKEKADAKKL